MPHFLAQEPALLDARLEPDGPLPETDSGTRAIVRAWNLHGGLLSALSERVGIDVSAAVAVLLVESGGSAFGPDGRMIIRFENHIFRKEWGSRSFDRFFRHSSQRAWEGHVFRMSDQEEWAPFHGRQASEWRVFEFARRKNETAAMRSISMGAPQIMGFNHSRIGYEAVQEMFERFNTDVRFQILGLFDFLAGGATDSPMLEALRKHEFGRFASGYNGPGQASVYGELISRHVELFERVRGARRRTRATPVAEAATTDNEAAAATPAAPPTRPARSYVVKQGDTLGAIAGRYGVPLSVLVETNEIADPNLIRVGQVVRIPATEAPPEPPAPAEHRLPIDLEEDPPEATERTYTVVAGDTLGAIARRNGVTVDVLSELNDIENPDRIFAGQVLRLPD